MRNGVNRHGKKSLCNGPTRVSAVLCLSDHLLVVHEKVTEEENPQGKKTTDGLPGFSLPAVYLRMMSFLSLLLTMWNQESFYHMVVPQVRSVDSFRSFGSYTSLMLS
jgi:hypothetical protein